MQIVVVGGTRWSAETNQPSVQTVRELCKTHDVLYIVPTLQSSVLRHLLDPVDEVTKADAVMTVFRGMTINRVSQRLWVAPINGLPTLLPRSYPEISRKVVLFFLERFTRRAIEQVGFATPVLWFYWWFFPELATSIRHSLAVYDRIDRHEASPRGAQVPGWSHRTAALESRLIATADLSYSVSPWDAQDPRLRYQPSGVDLDFVEASLAGAGRPEELRGLVGPIIGYAGGIDERLNWDLVLSLATSFPTAAFVLVGARTAMRIDLPANVHVFLQRPYAEILRFIKYFDVAIMPFHVNAQTRGAFSFKLLDYLAAEKPILTSPVPAAEELKAAAPRMVTLASSPAEWRAGLGRLLAMPLTNELSAEALNTAARYSSASRVAAIVSDVERTLLHGRSP